MYDLIVASDAAMPAGKDWLLIRHEDGDLLVIRRGALGDPKLVYELWAGSREAGKAVRWPLALLAGAG